jgi:succinyl-CoA synthetase beta subunit
MNIHEYQAKALLHEYGVVVPAGNVVYAVDEVDAVLESMPADLWVVKAQIHAGGRGKAGGVILCKNKDDVKLACQKLLGSTLVTHQTGPKGQKIGRVYIETGTGIDRELYLSIVLNRKMSKLTVIASKAGGMDIEEVAAKTPEKIINYSIDPLLGVRDYMAKEIAFALDLKNQAVAHFSKLLSNLYEMFLEKDATLIEINPLVVTKEGDLMVLDAKVSFDENALFRHQDIEALRDEAEEDPSEVEAKKYDLNYVKLDGTIGCMVNGAGLAMATMDIIKLYGAYPANFLDVGGGATQEKVTAAFKIILSDPDVKAILINIFGGIMRCDIIASGIVSAAKDIRLTVPLVVRLQGTNMDQGKEILKSSGIAVITADSLEDAASKVVEACK